MTADLATHIRLAADVLRKYGATEVYVFGSAASGKMHAHSDIDLAVSGLDKGDYFRALGGAYEVSGHPLDVVDLSQDSRLARRLRKMRDAGTLLRVA